MTSEEYIRLRREKCWFLVPDSRKFVPNIHRIHPRKQEYVKRLYEYCCTDPLVQRVYVFGSSLTDLCHSGSDLDICVEWDVLHSMDEDGVFIPEVVKSLKGIRAVLKGTEADIVPFDQLDTDYKKIRDSILGGVVIYKSDNA